MAAAAAAITRRAYARAGLLGNPSDGYGGRTLSVLLANFAAAVTLVPLADGAGVRVVPHARHDPGASTYASAAALADAVACNGYDGGVRLLLATVKRFVDVVRARGLPTTRDVQSAAFELSYDTDVPRQTGLSGSSAIVGAALLCLLEYFGVADADLPREQRPELILSVERELGITAGLQDRVIQTYGGLVLMDFEPEAMARRGHGDYRELDPALLPPLWLVWADNPSDSGRVHARVRQRYDAGEAEVVRLMGEIAALPVAGAAALAAGDVGALADAMDRNFDLRRELFGDAALGARNLEMIAACRRAGAAAKFTGSGGAAVALCRAPGQEEALKAECAKAGFCVAPMEVKSLT